MSVAAGPVFNSIFVDSENLLSRPISDHGLDIIRAEQRVRSVTPFSRIEVIVLTSQSVIDALAGRIERAYRLRRAGWQGTCSTPRVWAVAATTLLQAHQDDPSLPLDPELFVAAQPTDSPFADPWGELTRAESVRAYRKRVRQIVRGLHDELAGEILHAERQIESGQSVGKVLLSRSRRLSPLGRYIVAHRAGRAALAKRFLHGAAEQHRACPLYRQASSGLLPAGCYPVPVSGEPVSSPVFPPVRSRAQVHLN
jgi:hypothetical protein